MVVVVVIILVFEFFDFMGVVLIYYISIFKPCLTKYVSLYDEDNNNVIPPLIFFPLFDYTNIISVII